MACTAFRGRRTLNPGAAMSVVDREPMSVSAEELERMTSFEPTTPPSRPDPGASPSGPGRILLATLSAGAGVIHLVMVTVSAAVWLPEAIAFAVAGWLQIGLAVVFLTLPSRAAVRLSCLANALFVGAWAVTRVTGWPFGPAAGQRPVASFVDLTCVTLEVALVVAGAVLLSRPDRGASLSQSARVALSIVPLGILVLASAAIVSPSAATQGRSSDSASVTAGDHDHGSAVGSSPTTAVDDKGLSQIMNGQGEGGGHNHTFAAVSVDATTQQQLDAQIAKTQPLVDKYPTVKDAEAAGFHRMGPYSPGIGAHYMGPDTHVVVGHTTLTDDDLGHPTLIYDGIDPSSKLAGFMYEIFSLDTQNPPEGFVGPNDHWHYHTNVCITTRPDGGVDAPLGADTTATPALCDKYHGHLIANTGYMAHVWSVPGWESSQGLFSNVNPKLACPDGSYYMIPLDEVGNRSTVCKNV
jgi:hypothetical protein